MASGEFQVVFRGALTGDYAEETVKQRLADQFGMSTQRIDALFTGKPVVVKKNVDRGTAERFQQAFRKAGAECELRGPEGATASNAAQAPGAGEAGGEEGAGPDSSTAETATNSSASATGEQTETAVRGSGSIAAAGDPNATIVALSIPTSFEGLEMDTSEAPLTEAEKPQAPRIDTSDLTLTEDESEPLAPPSRPAPPEIDISGLSVEPTEDDAPR